MNKRSQVCAEIAKFEELLKTQREKFALTRDNLTATQTAIERTRARKIPLTPKESEELDNALKNSHLEVSNVIASIIAMERDLKALMDVLSRLQV